MSKKQSKKETELFAQESALQEEQEAEYKNLYLRVAADFQNYKRRITKERRQWAIDAQVAIITPLLEIIDDLDRAIGALLQKREDKEIFVLHEGLGLIQKKMSKIFKDLGVVEVECSGQFNPMFHEALFEVESSDYAPGQVVEVISKGYVFKPSLGEEPIVVRPAKVSVAK